MKKILFCTAVILVISFVSIIALDVFRGDSPEGRGVIITGFQSAILKEERELIIRLPRLYDSAKRYPVFYVLDGSSLDRPIADKLEVLSSLGYAPEGIVVGIPNMTAESRQKNLVPPFMHTDQEDMNSAMGEGDRFLEFIEDEVIPFVNRQYATTTRIFCGNSRGGLLVMYSLIHKPGLFDARICFSTPFWREDDILIDRVESFLSSAGSVNSFIFLSAGNNETVNIKGGLERMTAVLNKNGISGITVRSYLTPGAVHADNAVLSSAQAIDAWEKYRAAK
jgi:hypothetical protein